MHADFFKHNPFRQPQWRAERVWELVTHRSQLLRPRRYDDAYVRQYYFFLLSSLANGKDEESQDRVRAQRPHVYQAHELYYSPDQHRCQRLEAWLLTDEPFERIAERFDVDPLTIEFFEALFFNVRDRLDCRDWIYKVIKGPFEQRGRQRYARLQDVETWEANLTRRQATQVLIHPDLAFLA